MTAPATTVMVGAPTTDLTTTDACPATDRHPATANRTVRGTMEGLRGQHLRNCPTPSFATFGEPRRTLTRVTRVLITGMSGVGKSSLLAELARRGYHTVDTDYDDFHETIDGERLWREDRIAALLEDTGPLFVQGTTRNQVVFYPLFDHIVLLSAPAEVLVERLTTRTTNPYGKDPAEVAETLDYLATVEPLLRQAATPEVVTTVPVAQVADIIVAHCL